MKEVTEKYYMAVDGKKFKDENECKKYEEAALKIKTLRSQIDSLNKELACAEYILYDKCKYIESVKSAGGCGHDGYYHKCPHCEELVGGYERRNTSLKVDENTYKCEKCGKFFRYS
jgi:predicted RNA-binding Zn-ribbon protein involved in translation (DUF1610 family)